MFDLIEESLSDSEPKNQSVGSMPHTPSDAVQVYTMPEKFLPKMTKSSISPLLIGIIVVLILGSGGLGVFFLLQNQQPSPLPITTPTEQPQATEAPTSTTTSSSEQPTTTQQPQETPAEQPVPEGQPVTLPPAPVGYVDAIDGDRDGLTDIEEGLYSTDKGKPDSDADGFLDAGEVKALYDPAKGDRGTLIDSGAVSVYKNPTFTYSLYYPTSWVAKPTNNSNREVLFSSSTGEFVSLSVQDNPEKLAALDWYAAVKSPGADTSKLQTISYGSWSGVMSEDGLTTYLTRRDSQNQSTPYIYVVQYVPGGKTELSFRTTFQMMIRSLMTSL